MKMRNELKIFDIDETLFETTAVIRVLKDGKVVKTLSNSQYNTYELNDGEQFCFSEFKDADKFYSESKPIQRMIEEVKKSLDDGHDVKIVTARADFDNKERFLQTFRERGIDIDKIYVYRAGNMDNRISPATKKAIIISDCLKATKYTKVSLFDDSLANLKEFLNLKKIFRTVEFDAVLAYVDGSVERIQ
jgi:hypothetical protein